MPWESNLRTFALWDDAQPAEPHCPGLDVFLIKQIHEKVNKYSIYTMGIWTVNIKFFEFSLKNFLLKHQKNGRFNIQNKQTNKKSGHFHPNTAALGHLD